MDFAIPENTQKLLADLDAFVEDVIGVGKRRVTMGDEGDGDALDRRGGVG